MKNHGNSWSLFRVSDRKQFDDVSLETIDFFFRALDLKARGEWLMWREDFSDWRPLNELSQVLPHLVGDEVKRPSPPPVPSEVLNSAGDKSPARGTNSGISRTIKSVAVVEEAFDVVEHDLTPVPDVTEKTITHSSVSSRALAAMSSRRLSAASPPAKKADEKVLTMDEATMSLMLESQAAVEDRDHARYQKRFKIRIFAPHGIVAAQTIDCSTSGFRLQEPLPTGLPKFFHVEIDLGPEGKITLVCSEVREKDGRAATRARIQINEHVELLQSALMRAA